MATATVDPKAISASAMTANSASRPAPKARVMSQPLERVPLFVRRGAVIPVVEPGDCVGDGPFDAITLLCFDPTDGATIIRDVDGDTVIDYTTQWSA